MFLNETPDESENVAMFKENRFEGLSRMNISSTEITFYQTEMNLFLL